VKVYRHARVAQPVDDVSENADPKREEA